MKALIFSTVVIILFCSTKSLSQTYEDDVMNARESLGKASTEMALLIRYIDSAYSDNTALQIMLKSSQKAWEKYSDTQVKMRYPSYTTDTRPSIMAICVSNYMTKLINARIEILKEWERGIEEGDVCAGSIKFK